MLRGLLTLACLAACGGGSQDASEPARDGGAPVRAANCPVTAKAPSPLPHVEAKHRTLAYWLERTPDLDETLLDVDRIHDMNTSLAVERGADWHGENDLVTPVDRTKWATDTAERLGSQREKLLAGDLVQADGSPVPSKDIAEFDPARAKRVNVVPELRVALAAVPIRCGPRVVGFFSKPAAGAPPNTRFDRNNCSTAHPQEVVQILGTWPNGMKMARTRYATGWISGDAKLSPPIPEALREAFVNGPRVQADQDLALQATKGAAQCPAGTLLPLTTGSETRVHFATATGFHESAVAEDRVQPTRRPLTRRALLTEAFRFLDTSYGWGGGNTAGGHDCSGFMMDLFAAFDLRLPRHSSWQARAGTFSIDTSKVTSDAERARLIDAAAKKGVVLLSFPGHVMLYLGRTEAGAPMVLHAIAEYVQPCPGGGETIFQIDKINVSDLELGRGSSRKALIERITRITVIGKPPGVELIGAAELRPAAPVAYPGPSVRGRRDTCKDSDEYPIYQSPRRPNAKQPLRVITAANRDFGAAELALFDPAGRRVAPSNVTRLAGGPPWSIIATVDKPTPGEWTAVLGDGSRVDACFRVRVSSRPPGKSSPGLPTDPTWSVRRRWGRAAENLYATFVQRLFDYPPDQDVTWPNLHVLLRDPSRNILHDYLQHDEEDTLKLQPDCADLPYLLRAYFAWKLGLPFVFHQCSRGNANHPPICKRQFSNLMIRDWLDDKRPKAEDEEGVAIADDEPLPEPEETDGIEEETISDVKAFELFWGRQVSWTVHAASGRTVPDAETTDYYPIPLSRDWLRPGVAYHDPFGHVMVIAQWVPQTATSYGMLLAADAQPDGTVGRKRFWRGNFLFTTDTRVAGAGFKAFRPVFPSKEGERDDIAIMKNDELKRTRVFAPFSRQQYEGTLDTFHDTMEALINPRPLDPSTALGVLVDSLHSQAKLRVVSVKNGEDWATANPDKVMPMPDGADIFLTSEVLWEDFATPSRDFRILIAIDTVMGFPASIARTPARFGLEPNQVDAAVARIEKELDAALRVRTIEYVRSDGKPQTLTMRDVVDRKLGFEMSYNPNDCIEVRWGAVEGSAEYASCKRHAPDAQVAKMTSYRPWFHDRRRPSK